jgi:hypothetical protein
MLDIDLISEPPPRPLPPDVCTQSVGICVARGAGSYLWLAGVSGCHIYVPVPHAPPPKGIGQRSKIVILPTTDENPIPPRCLAPTDFLKFQLSAFCLCADVLYESIKLYIMRGADTCCHSHSLPGTVNYESTERSHPTERKAKLRQASVT